jgi:hypothetical protein
MESTHTHANQNGLVDRAVICVLNGMCDKPDGRAGCD